MIRSRHWCECQHNFWTRVQRFKTQTSHTLHDNSIICQQIPTGDTCPRIYWYHDEIPGENAAEPRYSWLTMNLLSAYSAEALGMITLNFTFHMSVPIPDKFPSLFNGKIGKISGVIINLHMESSVPPVTQRHRRIPFHVRQN